MDYIVKAEPAEVLDEVHMYVLHGWPFGGFIRRYGATLTVEVLRQPGPVESLLDFGLYLITLGILGASPKEDTARMVANRSAPGQTLLSVDASRRDMRDDLGRWAIEFLGARPLKPS